MPIETSKVCQKSKRSDQCPLHKRQLPIQGTCNGAFDVAYHGAPVGTVRWTLIGEHNRMNALAALAAAEHIGVSAADGIAALSRFGGVKRRMELRGSAQGIRVYDDFAHHPTAIATTIEERLRYPGEIKVHVIRETRVISYAR